MSNLANSNSTESRRFATQLGMLRLGSAALPIGAFAYSQGLESAIAQGEVTGGPTAEQWITGVLENSILTCDIPLLTRMHSAWQVGDSDGVLRWSDQWRAMRGTRELRDEDRQLGQSLLRLLTRQAATKADSWLERSRVTLGCAFSLASVVWEVDAPSAAATYVFAWSEAQVGAAARLIPLGQTEAQRILALLLNRATQGLVRSLSLNSNEIASSTPGQSLHSSWHETLYTRLFRS